MTGPVIVAATEEEVRTGELGRRLREFNYEHIGRYPEVKPIWLNAKDANGVLLGGLRAVVAMHWLRVEVLWVSAAHRHKKIGSRLLAEAEKQARVLGARNAGAETFEFQAPGFYRSQGYTEAWRIEEYVPGYYLGFMKKPL